MPVMTYLPAKTYPLVETYMPVMTYLPAKTYPLVETYMPVMTCLPMKTYRHGSRTASWDQTTSP